MNDRVIGIEDASAGSRATISVAQGFNCFGFQVPAQAGPLNVLWAEEGFEQRGRRASGSGIPILFPFPGRIRGGVFSFQGRRYELDHGDGRGNAIHGLVLDQPWRVIGHTENRAIGEILLSEAVSDLDNRWPADARIQVAYEISGPALSCQVEVTNVDAEPLPFGFGTHPYFRIPLAKRGSAGDCRIKVPANRYWELDDLLPTGRRHPVSGDRELAAGKSLAGIELDDVFADLEFSDGVATTNVEDPTSGQRIVMTFDDGFGACVVYTPPHGEAVCIEPYTCVPDAIHLAGDKDATGLRILAPGESARLSIEIRVE